MRVVPFAFFTCGLFITLIATPFIELIFFVIRRLKRKSKNELTEVARKYSIFKSSHLQIKLIQHWLYICQTIDLSH
jgi:hypothetical protein